jgi:exosome complex RNA-binding protein Rrp4
MTSFVIPGQPLSASTPNGEVQPGPGTFVRGGKVYASRVGKLTSEGQVSSSSTLLYFLELIVYVVGGERRRKR